MNFHWARDITISMDGLNEESKAILRLIMKAFQCTLLLLFHHLIYMGWKDFPTKWTPTIFATLLKKWSKQEEICLTTIAIFE